MSGMVYFGENVGIAAGVKLSCAEGATLQIGKNSSINVNSQVICMEHIALGENVMLSWDDLVMDSDFHPIREGTMEKPVSRPIMIGDLGGLQNNDPERVYSARWMYCCSK